MSSTRLRGLGANPDFLAGQDLDRVQLPVSYQWLQPCEGPRASMEREGPLRRLRPSRSNGVALPAVQPQREAPRQKGTQPRVSCGKKPDHTLWAAGAAGPLWAPMTEDEKAWRHMTCSAVQASMAVRGGARGAPGNPMMRSASMPGPGRRQQRSGAIAGAKGGGFGPGAPPGVIRETPGLEAWDSVSQADTVTSSRRGPMNAQAAEDWSEVRSAETMTRTSQGLPVESRLDLECERHLARNRTGWYEWHGGRLLG